MRKIIRKITSLFSCIPTDKWIHFSMSVLISSIVVALLSAYSVLPIWAVSALGMFSVLATGLVKEYVVDTEPDPLDMVANILGALVVIGLYMTLSL